MKENDQQRYLASRIEVCPVENGFIVGLSTYDSAIAFIAPTMDDVCAILRDTNLRTMARPSRLDEPNAPPTPYPTTGRGY